MHRRNSSKEDIDDNDVFFLMGHGRECGRPSPALSSSSAASTLTLNASLNAVGGIMQGLDLHSAGEMGNDGLHHHWGDERPEMCVAFVFFV
jgi:hypothetical protein